MSGEIVQRSKFVNIKLGDILYVEGQDWDKDAQMKAVAKVVEIKPVGKNEEHILVEDESQERLVLYAFGLGEEEDGDLSNVDLWYLVERKA